MNLNRFQTLGLCLLLHVGVVCQAASAPRLSILRTNSPLDEHYAILLEGETKGRYSVLFSTNLNDWTTRTNISMGSWSKCTIWGVVPGDVSNAYYRAMRLPMSMFLFALVTRGQIDLNGYNLYVDSYNSSDPNYSTDGRYDISKRRDRGDVAGSIINTLAIGNCSILGHLFVPPEGSVVIGPMGSVGEMLWHMALNKGVEPGWLINDLVLEFPDTPPPFSGGYFTPASGTNDGGRYEYILADGNYMLDSLYLAGSETLLVKSNATLYVMGDVNISGAASIVISTGACLRLFVAGTTSLLGNGVLNYTGNATNFAYFGLPSNTSLNIGGNFAFLGVVYAPNADLTIYAGSLAIDYLGSFVVKSLRLNAHVNFHYDEALQRGPYFR